MFKSLRSRFILDLLALALLPLLVVSLLIAQQSYSTLQQMALTTQNGVAERLAGELLTFMRDRQSALLQLRAASDLQGRNRGAQEVLLHGLLASEQDFIELALLDNQGRELLAVQTEGVSALSDREAIHAAAFTQAYETGQIYYGPVRYDETVDEPLLTLAVPVSNPRSSEVLNVLVAELRFRPVWNMIASLRLEGGEVAYVVDARSGAVIAHSDVAVVLQGTTYILPESDGRTAGLSVADAILATAEARIGNQEFVVAVESPYAQATALADDLLKLVIGAGIVAGGLALGLVVVTLYYVVRPIERLAAIARAIQGGDFSRKAN
ncbi:MAG: cache domain-containing protein, partial [Anaerolineae bacterium]|nr:cache domain-containing protein [Anaerolineae bacterium]